MSDLVIQVLIRKLSNVSDVRHIYSQTSTRKLEISSNRINNSRNQMKAYDKLAELKHRFWCYSILQSFSVTNPGLKNNVFVCLFPIYTFQHNRDLTIVSLVGITTRRAER